MAARTKAPRRTLDKQEAIRHLIHTAIRLIVKMEDPFAVHVLAQSADKLLIDMAKSRGNTLVFDWQDFIKPEYRKAFFNKHRVVYNYFKHADKDFDDNLSVPDIMSINVIQLAICVTNYNALFGEVTNHMTLLLVFVMTLQPELISPAAKIGGIELLTQVNNFEELTPKEVFTFFQRNSGALPQYTAEVSKDLSDIEDFYNLSFAELRTGKTTSDRIIRIPDFTHSRP